MENTREQLSAPIKAASIIVERCHRMGKQLHFRKRPIIVRFKHYADRDIVWRKRSLLRNKSVSLHENFATEVEFRRRFLYPILSSAKKSGKYEHCLLNGDVPTSEHFWSK